MLRHIDRTEAGFETFCVAARHVDHAVWEKSSSGGAFSAICEAYCNNGDVIFGAKFEGLRVVHDYVCSVDEIAAFRKSKYVQSDPRSSYRVARDMLAGGRKVLFSGTPCQIAGLRSVLGKEYDNLLCVDLICHGVGSPKVFERYIEYLEVKYRSRMSSFTFRNKKQKMCGRFLEYIVGLEFEDGTRIELESDLYNRGFMQGLFSRPSCSECMFANMNRVGDITLGDLKGRYDVLPKAEGMENLSTVIVNTSKGREVFQLLDQYMYLYPVATEEVVRTQDRLRQPQSMSERREDFFEDLSLGVPIDKALRKHVVAAGLMRSMWHWLPDRLRYDIKRRLRWIRT
jgi:coenzyme F420-reducing hydrogenase beta subunit